MMRALLAVSMLALALVQGSVSSQNSKAPQVTWAPSLKIAAKRAQEAGRLRLIFFFAEQCRRCTNELNQLFSHPSVVEHSKQFVCVRLDVNKHRPFFSDTFPDKSDRALPAILFLDAKGKEVERFTVLLDPSAFAGHLLNVLNGDTLPSLEERARRDPDNLNIICDLAVAYIERDMDEKAKPLADIIFAIKDSCMDDLKARLHLHLGIHRALHYAPTESMKHLEIVVRKFPASIVAKEAEFHLGVIYLGLSKFDEAAKLLAAAASNKKNTLLALEAQKLLNLFALKLDEKRGQDGT